MISWIPTLFYVLAITLIDKLCNFCVSECIGTLYKLFGDAIYIPETDNVMSRLKDPSEEFF